MTPEEKQQLSELYQWMQQRKVQQLSYPVDDASKNSLGVPLGLGAGSTAKTQVYTDSNSDTHTGPKAYARTVLVSIDGVIYEFPSLV